MNQLFANKRSSFITPLGIVSQFTDNKVFSEKFVPGGSFSISPVISLNTKTPAEARE